MSSTSPPASPFTGSIPRHYDQYLGPLFFEPYAIEVASRVDKSSVQVALELCCGTGRLTHHLRNALRGDAKLIASDLSDEMLQVAKEKLGDKNVEWRKVDLHELPFNDNSIDLVACCFGYMFARDKTQAFGEARRVLRPGGMLLLSTWDKLENNPVSAVFRTTVKKYLGDPLPDYYNLPFSMCDPAILQEQLQQAGFEHVSVEVVEKPSTSPSAAHATYGLVQGGSLYNELVKRNPAWVKEVTESVERELSEKYGNAPMSAPMRALIASTKK